MTALGAGTALSTLHAFGRGPVLHGHGRYFRPRASCVAWPCGDVLLASAGSAGHRERLDAAGPPRRRSPLAFVQYASNSRKPEWRRIVSFSPKQSKRPSLRRSLAGDPAPRTEVGARVREIRPRRPCAAGRGRQAVFALSPSAHPARWDFSCERRVELPGGGQPAPVHRLHSRPSAAGPPAPFPLSAAGRAARRTRRRGAWLGARVGRDALPHGRRSRALLRRRHRVRVGRPPVPLRRRAGDAASGPEERRRPRAVRQRDRPDDREGTPVTDERQAQILVRVLARRTPRNRSCASTGRLALA